MEAHEEPENYTDSQDESICEFTSTNYLVIYDRKYGKITICILLVIISLVISNLLFQAQTLKTDQVLTSFPKILWLYSDNEFDSLYYPQLTMANYLIHKGQQFGYEVRVINHTSAYDWLTPQMTQKITSARAKVKLDVGIDDLILLGILIQNGGIFMQRYENFILDDFSWIEEGFANHHYNTEWTCSGEQAQVMLFPQTTQDPSFIRYSDSIIAAKPGSTLLEKAMTQYIQMSTSEPDLNKINSWMFKFDDATLTVGSPHIVQYSLSMAVKRQVEIVQARKAGNSCSVLGLQTKSTANPVLDTANIPDQIISNYLSKKKSCNSQLKMLIQVSKHLLESMLAKILRNQLTNIQEGSLMHQVINSKGNKQIFIDQLPQKEIQFCIVTLQQMKNEEQIWDSFFMLKTQIYPNWTAVYLVNNMSQINREKLSISSKIMQDTGNKGLNIEQALTKHCPHHSYAILLNKNQYFSQPTALVQLADNMKSRGVLGSLVTLKINNEEKIPYNSNRKFYRKDDGIINPDLPRMKQMLNHLRVFSVQIYKFLPQFDLHDSYGNYYQDRLIFIMSFYDMVRDPLDTDVNIYIVKKYAHKFDIPQRIVLSANVVINTNVLDEIDMEQMKKIFAKIDTESMRVVIDSLNEYRVSFDKMLTFNQGYKVQNFQQKKGPNLIEPIIHQAWLGVQMQPVKKYLFDKTALMFPQFEMKLWSLQNITKQNFPFTYQILKNICQFNRYSPYNKFATMTDILRHEALYHHGGFWKDSSMNFLKPVLNDFRKYKLVIGTDKSLRHRYLQGMCFYGHVKNYQPAMRINSFRHLNRMKIYQTHPFDIAGPVDFRLLIDRDEQYDPQILIFPYEIFYPGQIGQHPAGDMCTQQVNDKPHEKYESIKDNWGILKNCQQIYPYAFGIEHIRYGSTWVRPTGTNRQNPRFCQIK